jgi:hypothetical protein
MKAPREIKKWMARLRRRYGKKNGVVYSGMLDHLDYKWTTDKREKRRRWSNFR